MLERRAIAQIAKLVVELRRENGDRGASVSTRRAAGEPPPTTSARLPAMRKKTGRVSIVTLISTLRRRLAPYRKATEL
jgi:hypothetical protein